MPGKTAAKESFEPSGALPDPAILKKYEDIIPGAAKTLLDAFAKESEHRRSQEQKLLDAEIGAVWRGQVFGLLIGLTAIIGGSTTASCGAEWAGAIIGGGGVIGLVSAFLLKRLPIASPTSTSQQVETHQSTMPPPTPESGRATKPPG